MTTKTFEVRDRGTFVPMMAIRLDPADERDRWLLARAGYGRSPETQREYVILLNLTDGGRGTYDPAGWETRARTFPIAHQYIIDNFDALGNGSVICVEHILGERESPKVSEQVTHG